MKKRFLLVSLLLTSLPALAGRPLGTDDAATVGDKQCQFEAWRERGQESNAWVASPACGLGEFELGAEFSWEKFPEGQKVSNQGLAVKWAPEFLNFGPVSLGAKIWNARAKTTPVEEDEIGGWIAQENGALLLASWDIGAGFAAHANLGSARNRVDHSSARLAKLALTYTPHERVLLFTESQGTQRGGINQAVGMRLWAIPEKLGIDFTASHTAGVRNTKSLGIGFGWYGFLGN
jgi:hypothetical protein